MKTSNVIVLATVAVALLGATVTAMADTPPARGLTRAEVKAQIAEASAKGELLRYRPAADFSDDIAPPPRAARVEVTKPAAQDPAAKLAVAAPKAGGTVR